MTWMDRRIEQIIKRMESVHDGQAPWILTWYGKHDPISWGIVEPTAESILKAYATCYKMMVEVDYLASYMFEDNVDEAKLFLKAQSGDIEAKMELVLAVVDHEYMRTELSSINPFS